MPKISKAALEEAILAILCFNNDKAAEFALRLQDDTKIFSDHTNQTLANTALDYIRKYSVSPGMQLEYLLEGELQRGNEGKHLGQSIVFLQKQVLNLDAAFILEQLDRFIDIQKLQFTFENALELLDQGEPQQARESIYRQVALPINDGVGINLFDPKQSLKFYDMNEASDYFSSGIEVFDRRRLRPEKKTLIFVIGAAKKGKSWWLVEVGKSGIQYHHNVLHITLEISQEKTAKRYVQALFGLTSDEVQQIRTPYFQMSPEGSYTIAFRDLVRESVFDKRRDITAKLHSMAASNPKFIIKEFPTGFLTTEHLCLYLDSLERNEGFKPDLLIIDYADLMKINAESFRIDTGRLYRDLRGIAVSRNLALVTASQGNQEADTAKLVTKRNVAEDWSKVCTADLIFTYSQTPEEKRLNLARMFAAGGRDTEDGIIALISQSYATGQFAIDSTAMTVDLANYLRDMAPTSSS